MNELLIDMVLTNKLQSECVELASNIKKDEDNKRKRKMIFPIQGEEEDNEEDTAESTETFISKFLLETGRICDTVPLERIRKDYVVTKGHLEALLLALRKRGIAILEDNNEKQVLCGVLLKDEVITKYKVIKRRKTDPLTECNCGNYKSSGCGQHTVYCLNCGGDDPNIKYCD